MGIGDDFPKGRQVDYVLGRFTQQELDALPSIMDKAISMSLGFCTMGIAQTMKGQLLLESLLAAQFMMQVQTIFSQEIN
jgi:peptidyl-tRNA hydrolase